MVHAAKDKFSQVFDILDSASAADALRKRQDQKRITTLESAASGGNSFVDMRPDHARVGLLAEQPFSIYSYVNLGNYMYVSV